MSVLQNRKQLVLAFLLRSVFCYHIEVSFPACRPIVVGLVRQLSDCNIQQVPYQLIRQKDTRMSEVYFAYPMEMSSSDVPLLKPDGFVKVPKKNIFQLIADYDFIHARWLFTSPDNYLDRSIAFYQVSRGLGTDIVPLTRPLRLPDGRRGIYQTFVDGKSLNSTVKSLSEEEKKSLRPQIHFLAILDIIALSQDRHLNNLLLEQGRLRLVDNDRSFPLSEKAHWRWRLPFGKDFNFACGSLEPLVRQRLESYTVEALVETLRANEIPEAAINLARDRYLKMQELLLAGASIERVYGRFFD